MDFDDARLEDSAALASADDVLRHLASTGARIRTAAVHMFADNGALRSGQIDFDHGRRPRGVITLGTESRLIRAVLEPVCPVPFVAWPIGGLPGWVGPLDLVVVLAPEGSDADLVAAAAESVRRGASLIVAAPPHSPIADAAASRSTLQVPMRTADPLAGVVVVLAILHQLGLAPVVLPEQVARAADLVAEQCSPHRDLSTNPAKDIALCLGDGQPLVWGGSVLAARAARRIAEALRRASGRPALAEGAEDLAPVLAEAGRIDPFADPFDTGQSGARRPVLVLLDDHSQDARVRRERAELIATARRHEVRICEVDTGLVDVAGGVAAYVSLLLKGLYGAVYLSLALDRPVGDWT